MSVAILLAFGCIPAEGQEAEALRLAKRLADPDARSGAIAEIAAAGTQRAHLLLSWSSSPPPGVDQWQLFIGLADAFGELKSKDAIPFLIRNISLNRYMLANTWMKTAEVIKERLPAVAALIRIGPVAGRAVVEASWEPMTSEDRIAAVFVVSQIPDMPGRQEFLNASRGEAHTQLIWAEEGLKAYGKR